MSGENTTEIPCTGIVGERLLETLAQERLMSDHADFATHGFHVWPAKMHPSIAHHWMKEHVKQGMLVLDPFCGSGTTLLEASMLGAESIGSDLNPISRELVAVKCMKTTQAFRKVFMEQAEIVAAASTRRVQSRQAVQAQLAKRHVPYYEPHVLKEMAGLLLEIQLLQEPNMNMAMRMVFSSFVSKFSKKKRDTSEDWEHKRLRKGLVTEFFLRKCHELTVRWEQTEDMLMPEPQVETADAFEISEEAKGAFDVLVSSPPYGGTYDYVDHHAMRISWLGYSTREFTKKEVGARRHQDTRVDPYRDTEQLLGLTEYVLKKNGKALLFIGDSVVRNELVSIRQVVNRVLPRSLVLEGAAWVHRNDWNDPEAQEARSKGQRAHMRTREEVLFQFTKK